MNVLTTEEIGIPELNRELDITKTVVFRDQKGAAFFGPLMCSLDFRWSRDTDTACTDGVDFFWNPDFFVSSSLQLRQSTLVHELQHVARLHEIRRNNRDSEIWNYACDYRINNDMCRDGFSFGEFKELREPAFDNPNYLSEEEIYDLIVKNPSLKKPTPFITKDGKGDIMIGNANHQKAAANVMKAIQQAKFVNKPGSIPGNIENLLNEFLQPVIPWENVLHQFFTDLLEESYTWRKPSRRSQEVYLPSRFMEDGRLEHLAYFLDTSMSVSDDDVLKFNSEIKFIHEELQPKKLSVIQFDTRITNVRIFEKDEPFSGIKVYGRGGTNWIPVSEWIEKNKPTCAVIFTDMGFNDCVPSPVGDIPVVWVVSNCRKNYQAPFGKTIPFK